MTPEIAPGTYWRKMSGGKSLHNDERKAQRRVAPVAEPVGELIEAHEADFDDMRVRFIKLRISAEVIPGQSLYAAPPGWAEGVRDLPAGWRQTMTKEEIVRIKSLGCGNEWPKVWNRGLNELCDAYEFLREVLAARAGGK